MCKLSVCCAHNVRDEDDTHTTNAHTPTTEEGEEGTEQEGEQEGEGTAALRDGSPSPVRHAKTSRCVPCVCV